MPVNRVSRSKYARLWGVPTLLVAVLAALVGPTGAAYAAVSQPTVTSQPAVKVKAAAPAKQTVTTKAGATQSASSAVTSAATEPKKPQLVTRPTAPTKAKLPAAPAADSKSLRAAATRSAMAHNSVPDTCSGAIVADTVYPCAAPTGTDTYTVTLPDAADLLVVRAVATGGSALPITVTAPDSDAVTCQQPVWYQPPQCATTQAGTYTVQVQDGGSAFTLAYTALLSDTSCTVANPSFSAPTIQGSLAAGAVGNCYTLAMTSGSVLHAALSSTPYQELNVVVYDATGAQICVDDQGDCTLTGTAPYRVLASDTYGNANTYALQLNSVSQPQGCLAVAQQTYGTVPETTATIACRTLTVTTAGQYQVYAATAQSGGIGGTLYNPDGTVACTNSGSTCQLASGTYDFVATEYPQYVMPFGVVFIAADESRGCTATTDTDFAAGPAKGSFGGIGEEICLNLPTASGESDYIFDQATADGSSPQMQVVDATGVQQCPSASFTYATCQLTGTAPFHMILSAQEAHGGYQVLAQRTDSAAGCAVWPQSGFGGSWGAEVPLTTSANVKCLSIPANQHSVGEMIDYQNNTNTVNGNITVNDPTGKQICIGTSTAICSYTPGVAYTALVMGVSLAGPDTYKVVRRDVSQTASCTTPASTTVGGPSTEFLLNSALDAQCVRVTAAAADKIWTDARATAPTPAGVVEEVADASGTIVCRQWGVSCQVTGSTSYQVIVIASGYAGVVVPAHVDTWLVGTAAGWAPQCTAHPLSANGFAPQSGSLSESTTAYCAVVQMPPKELLGIGVVEPTNTGGPAVSMYDDADWTNGLGLCNIGGGSNDFSVQCETQSSTTDPAVMLVTPGASPTPISYTTQGVCENNCATPPTPVTLTGISPAVGPAGTQNVVTVHGTGLNLGTELDLASNGVSVSNDQPNWTQSASADGTSLTVLLSTVGLTPGKYDLALSTVGYTVGTPSQGYLPGAYTVTAAAPAQPESRFVPVSPSRILDTRSGLGAPKARVGGRQTVKLKVEGVGGVPASGVTAVAMNVTEVNAAAAGFITAYPDGGQLPTASNINFTAGETIPNLVIVPVTDGRVDLYNGSFGPVDLLADITGYYSTNGSGSELTTVGPSRILDTRSGLGAPKARVGGRQTVKLKVEGVGGVPASGVTAVAMNVTEVNAAAAGFITAYPDGGQLPAVSNINFTAGETIPNLVIVPVTDGRVDLYNGSFGPVDLLADITGYYTASGSVFETAGPVRAMDTRSGTGRAGGAIAPGAAAVLSVMDLPLTPIPGTVTAVVLNVTVTSPTQGGFLTVFPDSQSLPTVSNLNFVAGETISNLVVVPVINGQIDFYNGSGGTVQVVADLDGYYTTP